MSAKPKKPKFIAPRTIERQYESQLRAVARHSAGIIKPHVVGAELIAEAAMLRRVEAYVEALDPWARRTAAKVGAAVDEANKRTWKRQAAEIKAALKDEAQGPIGAAQRKWQNEQVELIKSIPQDAAARAQALAREAIEDGSRAAEIAEKLQETEGVSLNKATLIARTEISKANTALTRARADGLGITHYRWVAMGDADTRESHQELSDRSTGGETFAWDDPPQVGVPGTSTDEGHHHPGDFPNCRCYPDPVLPDFE